MTAKQIRKDLNIVSLGAGKQSTFMLIKSLEGFFNVTPDKAIFIDLGSEPDFVYKNLEALQNYCLKNFSFTIDIIKVGPIDEHILNFIASKNSTDNAPPFYLSNGGMLKRHCTSNLKLRPICQYLTQFRTGNNIIVWIGISLDEIERMTKSPIQYITNKYPLIEKRISLSDIKKYFSQSAFEEPGKSACYFCPFHSHLYWKLLKKQFPLEFKKACDFDNKIRNYPNLTSRAFLHSSLKPLDKINFDFHPSLFPELIEECVGLCGL